MSEGLNKITSVNPVKTAQKTALAAAIGAALVCLSASADAAVLSYDTSTSSGIQSTTGIWDSNTTADWTTNGGTALMNWTSNTDLAAFVLAAGSSGSTVTVSNASGQVGANSLLFSGSTGSTGTFQLGGSTLQLGAGGIRHVNTNGVLTISAPLQLTASQTWTSNKSAADKFVVSGSITSQGAATTNLTFDGISAGTGTGDGVTFNLAGTNSFSGSTTVTGSATLKLDYSSNDTQKLDSTHSLTLNNGKILINGGTYNESVASTKLGAGRNTINHNTTNTAILSLGTVTRDEGAILDVGTSNTNFVKLSNANVNGIVGGWATAFGQSGWLVGQGSSVVTATNGSNFTTTSGWTSTSNVKFAPAAGTYSLSSSANANVLQLSTSSSNITLNIDPSATLTLTSGGLMDSTNTGGSSINGGKITSGMSSGELFVYAPRSSGFNIGSQIVNNGSTATVLVKGGANALNLSGANTYTGKTYVNAGSLNLSGSAVGTVTGGVAVATNATFDPGAAFTVGVGKTVSGGGTIVNSVDASGATINPGDGVGALNIQGGLTLDASSVINFDINDLATGVANDKIVLGTAATRQLVLDGTLDVNNLGGLAVGTYTLISGFTSITDNGLLLSGVQGTITHDTSNVYLNVTAVPEPASLAAIGLGGLLALRRRRVIG